MKKHGLSPNILPNEARFQEYMQMLRMKERKTTRLIGKRIKRRIEAYHKIKYAQEEGTTNIGPKIE